MFPVSSVLVAPAKLCAIIASYFFHNGSSEVSLITSEKHTILYPDFKQTRKQSCFHYNCMVYDIILL